MQIVPAIDVKDGQVVRAVAGQRSAYRPIESQLAPDPRPKSIGEALVRELGLQQVYVADLDAIAGAPPAWDLYRTLVDCGLHLWIDAGLTDLNRAQSLAAFMQEHAAVTGMIGGLETLPDLATLAGCLELAGADRFVFSLDLKDGQPLTTVDDWRQMMTAEVAAAAIHRGVQHVMLIDLSHVGMNGGCQTERLCQAIHEQFPDITLSAGGGVRGIDDLNSLAAHGCSSALVSSALHDRRITAAEIRGLHAE